MGNLEIVKGIFQSDVRRNIRAHIQIQHEIGFESFLEANYLADEVYYIDLIYKQNELIIAEYEKIVNFHDISEGKEVTDDIANQWYNESITRDHYWYYKECQSFLEERLELITSQPEPQQPEPEPLDLSDTSTVEKTLFKNNFDNVTESKIIEYFTKHLVEKRYLTKETLTKYLKQAFELKTPPIQKFSFENLPTQGKIRKVFYDYFSTTAGKPSGRKLEYVKLLGEYFNGFETHKINTNFSK